MVFLAAAVTGAFYAGRATAPVAEAPQAGPERGGLLAQEAEQKQWRAADNSENSPAGLPGEEPRRRLSAPSLEAVRSLEKVVGETEIIVTVYASADLPETVLTQGAAPASSPRAAGPVLLALLKEYARASDGLIVVNRPSGWSLDEAKDEGLVLFGGSEAVLKDGELKFKQHVLGCTFHLGGQKVVLEQAIHPEYLEYRITSRLLRLRSLVEGAEAVKTQLEIAGALVEALDECHLKFLSFGASPGDDDLGSLDSLLKPIDDMEEEAVALAANRSQLEAACEGLQREYAGADGKQDSPRFDAFLHGEGGPNAVGGVAAYLKVLDEMFKALESDEPAAREIKKHKDLLVSLRADIAVDYERVRSSAGAPKLGLVCGHGEFCPFSSGEPVIDPEIAAMMGQQNPIHQRFLQMALTLQTQVEQVMSGVGGGLFKAGDLEIVRVDPNSPISHDLDAVALIGPTQPLSDRELYELDQYLLDGGTLVVLVSNFDVALASFSEEVVREMGPFNPNPKISNDHNEIVRHASNVDGLLAPYGVTPANDLVLDPVSNTKITLPHSMRRGEMVIRGTKDFDYPCFVHSTDLHSSHAAVRGLAGLTLPLCSSLAYTGDEDGGVRAVVLARSGARSVSLKNPAEPAADGEGWKLALLPAEQMGQVNELAADGPHVLAMVLTGKFDSAFTGRKIPDGPGEEGGVDEAVPSRERLERGEGRLLVIGSTLGLPPLTLEGVFEGASLEAIAQGGVLVPQVRFENWKVKVNQAEKAFATSIPALLNLLDWAVQPHVLDEIPVG